MTVSSGANKGAGTDPSARDDCVRFAIAMNVATVLLFNQLHPPAGSGSVSGANSPCQQPARVSTSAPGPSGDKYENQSSAARPCSI